MGLFSRSAPKPDPIGAICRLLAERPHEWAPGRDGAFSLLTHFSGCGLRFGYRSGYPRPQVWVNNGTGSLGVEQSVDDSDRLYTAILSHAAALVARPVHRFTDAAVRLADAVKAGDLAAAYLLVDEILEHHNRPSPPPA